MAAGFTQEGRPGSFRVHNPNVGDDDLLFERLRGTEAVSELFDFTVDLLAPKAVSFDDVLNQPATVTLSGPNGPARYFSGIIRSLEQGRRITVAAEKGGSTSLIRYRAHLVPNLWRLTRRFQSRVLRRDGMPSMTVLNALDQVLVKEWGLEVAFRLQDQDHRGRGRDRIVQYRETDFAFISRLLEDEGLWYYFEHTEEKDGLVITDVVPKPAPGTQTLTFNDNAEAAGQRVRRWRKRQEVRGNRVTLRDYCFQLADKDLTRPMGLGGDDALQIGSVSHQLAHPHAPRAHQDMLETYAFPAQVAQRFDSISKSGDEMPGNPLGNIHPDLERTADLRLQEEISRGFAIQGLSNYQHLTAGFPFKLQGHLDADDAYFLTRVWHEASQRGTYFSGEAVPFQYKNRFRCLPSALRYRPRRKTRRPRILGTQTAVVVAPDKTDAFLDKYGRVKVQFHWDREKAADPGACSCWVRVAQSWAGKTWGAFFWPRPGQEVVVTFEDGDPERPLITGSVYNNVNMPPADPKHNPHLAGFKSCTLGAPAHERYNSLVLDDQPGREHVTIHSETHAVDTCEATRYTYAPAPAIELVGQLPLSVPGSGSGGGAFDPMSLLNYTPTGSFLRDWTKQSIGFAGEGRHPGVAAVAGLGWAFINKALGYISSFPVKSTIAAGNLETVTVFGDQRSHLTGGTRFTSLIDHMTLFYGVLGGLESKFPKLAGPLLALKFLLDPLGVVKKWPPPMSGIAEVAMGPKTTQTYWGPVTSISRGGTTTYQGLMFAHRAELNADLKKTEFNSFVLIVFLTVLRFTCDILAVTLGEPKSESPGEVKTSLFTNMANGLGVSLAHAVLLKWESALNQQHTVKAKTDELERSGHLFTLMTLAVERLEYIDDWRLSYTREMKQKLTEVAEEQNRVLEGLQTAK